MLIVSRHTSIPESEIELTAIRAQGAGGQKVNKSSTAIHLRFDIQASSLPEFHKARLLKLRDSRITSEGVIVIKAQQYRSQEQNREDALARLQELLRNAITVAKSRRATKPTYASKRRRMDGKNKRGQLKQSRKKVDHRD